MNITDRIAQLGLSLPDPAMPLANYVPYKIINLGSGQSVLDMGSDRTLANDLLYLSGMVPLQDGKPYCQGKLGDQVSMEDGVTCAQLCTLNALAWANKALDGNLDRIIEVIRVRGFVASTPEFYDHPKVVNGCSDMLVNIFGDDGKHTRTVIGCAALPMNLPVEIDYVFSLR